MESEKMVILYAEYFTSLCEAIHLRWCAMRLDSRSTQKTIEYLFTFASCLFGAWLFGYLTVALIILGLCGIVLLVVSALERTGAIKVPYAEGEDAEHWTLNSLLRFPSQWVDVVDDVQRLFASNEKGSMDEQRFLEQINAVDVGQPATIECLPDAVHIKMIYEYRRKNGSLKCKKRGGNPMVDAVDVLRRLPDGERAEFIEFWNDLLRSEEERYAKAQIAAKTKTW